MNKKVHNRKKSIIQVYARAVFSDYSTWTIVAAAIGSLVGMIIAFIKDNDFAPLAVITLISSIVILLIKSILNIVTNVSDTNAYFYVQDDEEYKTKAIEKVKDSLPSNYKVIGNHNIGHIFYDEEVNNFIMNNDISLNVSKERYTLPKDLRSLLPFVLKQTLKGKKVFTDDKKVCLQTDIEVGVKFVSVRQATYYDGQVTSEQSSKRIRSRRDLRFKFNGIDLIYDFDINKVKSLSNNSLANRIGGSTLAITSDNYAVISIQGNINLLNAGKYVVTGSGSMDYKDLKGCKTLQQFLIKELKENCMKKAQRDLPLKKLSLLDTAELLKEALNLNFWNNLFNLLKR